MTPRATIRPCNKLCAKCLRHCKQPEAVLLVDCPRFLPFPFKVDKCRYEQLDLFDAPGTSAKKPREDEER